jgi:hypothetical protein
LKEIRESIVRQARVLLEKTDVPLLPSFFPSIFERLAQLAEDKRRLIFSVEELEQDLDLRLPNNAPVRSHQLMDCIHDLVSSAAMKRLISYAAVLVFVFVCACACGCGCAMT